MKSGEETALFLLGVIENAYKRPQMYARTADELDSLMYSWHSLLGFILDRKSDFGDSRLQVARGARCPGAQAFAPFYRRLYPKASEDKVVKYVVSKWQMVDRLLGLDYRKAQIDYVWGRYNHGER